MINFFKRPLPNQDELLNQAIAVQCIINLGQKHCEVSCLNFRKFIH